ncbi:hypothetical protein [Brucella oryzae]|uniref:Uncharacterized protein n=1 Tax=Brucella oryzae TaxID=335286 RepID=A0A2S7IW02_9HYPH|nr:hypothetical protein [Brucella oryzae]PQA72185.1 hypothetical protein C3731_17450 [Brucella oryzae]
MASEYSKFWLVWRYGGASPTFKHFTKESAESEAGRLALKEPGAVFFVVKAVSGFQADIPTINTVKLIKGDDIPF